mmetsp:Transcript_29162/g.62008  ORF Transcript_29162/g.62008 Transcript_29162/m.62008 type:complete len:121 (+) Transcript_29162:983-1345(+)
MFIHFNINVFNQLPLLQLLRPLTSKSQQRSPKVVREQPNHDQPNQSKSFFLHRSPMPRDHLSNAHRERASLYKGQCFGVFQWGMWYCTMDGYIEAARKELTMLKKHNLELGCGGVWSAAM